MESSESGSEMEFTPTVGVMMGRDPELKQKPALPLPQRNDVFNNDLRCGKWISTSLATCQNLSLSTALYIEFDPKAGAAEREQLLVCFAGIVPLAALAMSPIGYLPVDLAMAIITTGGAAFVAYRALRAQKARLRALPAH